MGEQGGGERRREGKGKGGKGVKMEGWA